MSIKMWFMMKKESIKWIKIAVELRWFISMMIAVKEAILSFKKKLSRRLE